MKRISIKPVWTLHDPDRPALPPRLLDLLVQVQATGSLLAACQPLGLSYRHAWDLVRQGEAHFDTPLLHMARGKGSTLTPLGDKLVWADHRIHARLKPVLESLASELSAEIAQVMSTQPAVLRLQASHGFAIERLVDTLGRAGVPVEHRYGSSTEAVAALDDGGCDVAGLHIPLGFAQDAALMHYQRWLVADDLVVVDIATRRQGLVVAAGNPRKVYELADLVRPDLRFINRQLGSGTRLLLETLLAQAGIAPAGIAGFEQGEFTHAAVAAYVAAAWPMWALGWRRRRGSSSSISSRWPPSATFCCAGRPRWRRRRCSRCCNCCAAANFVLRSMRCPATARTPSAG